MDCGTSITKQQSGNQNSILRDPEAVSEGKGRESRNDERESWQKKVRENFHSLFFFFFLVSLATLLSNQNLKSKLIVTRSHTLSRALPQVCTCICTEFKVAYSRVGSLVLVYLTQLKTALRTKPKPTKNYHVL